MSSPLHFHLEQYEGPLDLLLDLLFGAMWYRLLVAHAPLDRRLATAFADLVRRYR